MHGWFDWILTVIRGKCGNYAFASTTLFDTGSEAVRLRSSGIPVCQAVAVTCKTPTFLVPL